MFEEDNDSFVSLGICSVNAKIPLNRNGRISKIGGLPIWHDPASAPVKTLTCRVCHQSEFMVLVAQIYAPIDFDRSLYIFCCNKRMCSSNSNAWIVIRNQESLQQRHDKRTLESIDTADIPPELLVQTNDNQTNCVNISFENELNSSNPFKMNSSWMTENDRGMQNSNWDDLGSFGKSDWNDTKTCLESFELTNENVSKAEMKSNFKVDWFNDELSLDDLTSLVESRNQSLSTKLTEMNTNSDDNIKLNSVRKEIIQEEEIISYLYPQIQGHIWPEWRIDEETENTVKRKSKYYGKVQGMRTNDHDKEYDFDCDEEWDSDDSDVDLGTHNDDEHVQNLLQRYLDTEDDPNVLEHLQQRPKDAKFSTGICSDRSAPVKNSLEKKHTVKKPKGKATKAKINSNKIMENEHEIRDEDENTGVLLGRKFDRSDKASLVEQTFQSRVQLNPKQVYFKCLRVSNHLA
jgi:hypothetical protein